MDLKPTLSSRISMHNIHSILFSAQGDEVRKQELYNLLYDKDDMVAYQAAWVMTHYSLHENEWLYDKQNELIDEAMSCKHTGKRRLILSLLFRQPMSNPTRVDFLDFCLERMVSKREPVGIRSLCMKLAYELCRPTPELVQELKTILEIMDGELSPGIQAVRNNILKAMKKRISLQII